MDDRILPGDQIGARLACLLAVLATYLLMFGMARAHHPLGWLRWWGWA